ncbi:hypothetical protein CHUAL_006961 [Chamberlinius hualienensis]
MASEDSLKWIFTIFLTGDNRLDYKSADDLNLPQMYVENPVLCRIKPTKDLNKPVKNEEKPRLNPILTKRGKCQAFVLGRTYRRYYNEIINEEFKADEIRVRSRDYDSNLMTAQCCMAGLYPPVTEKSAIDIDLHWQPIPIHSVNSRYKSPDDTIYLDQLYDKYVKESFPTLYQTSIKHKDLVKTLLDCTSKDGPPDLLKIYHYLQSINYKKSRNMPFELPPGVDLKDAAEFMDTCLQLVTKSHSPSIKYGCQMLCGILDKMKQYIDGSRKATAHFYCLNEMDILCIFDRLEVPPRRTYCCGFMAFELHKLLDKKFYVHIVHAPDFDSEPEDVRLRNLESYFPIEKFEAAIENAIKVFVKRESYLTKCTV